MPRESLEQWARERLGPFSDRTELREYRDGQVIFEEGASSEDFFLVVQGEAVFRKRLPNGEYLGVSRSRPGDFFGEIGVLTGHARSLQAVAAGRTVLAKIPREALSTQLQKLPPPLDNLLSSIIQHLNATTRQYLDDMLRREKMAMIGSMVNSVIHDFKNPFCLISLSAQLIEQMHAEEPKTVRYCQNIREQVDRMVNMASELSEYSRGQQQLHRERINLREVVRHFQLLNAPYFQRETLQIVVDVPDLIVEGEAGKLLRVLQNLVGNAIDALGDQPGQITIRGQAVKRQAHLTIADNGPGIPEEIRARFWEPFVTQGKSGGTGLGSAIAKAIVEAHDGTARFETQTGLGTTIFIELPLAPRRRSEARTRLGR